MDRRVIMLIVLLGHLCMPLEAGLRLTSGDTSATIDPATLETRISFAGEPELTLSRANVAGTQPQMLTNTGEEARWRIENMGITAGCRLAGNEFVLTIHSDTVQKVVWPLLPDGGAATALVVPKFEGLYVPANSDVFKRYLCDESPMTVTEG